MMAQRVVLTRGQILW